MRLFAAVELPEAARRAVAERVAAAREAFPPASWVRSENLHLTLAFFGEVEEPRIDPLGEALARGAAAAGALRVRLVGSGAFPAAGPVRVVWLGVEPAARLGELAVRLREAAAAADFDCVDKPFASHVTLARCRRPWPPSRRRDLDRLAPAEEIAFDAEAASILASELAPGGPRYRRLRRLELGAAA